MPRPSRRDVHKVRSREMIKKIAKKSGYFSYEVQDIMRAFFSLLYNEIVEGHSIEFENLFTIVVSKSKKSVINQRGRMLHFPPRQVIKLRENSNFVKKLRQIARAENPDQLWFEDEVDQNESGQTNLETGEPIDQSYHEEKTEDNFSYTESPRKT